jgi:hypothetical protein
LAWQATAWAFIQAILLSRSSVICCMWFSISILAF